MLFPMEIASETVASEFFKAIPELNAYYGADATAFVKFSMTSGFSSKAVTFDMA